MDVHRCPRFILKMFFKMKQYSKFTMPSQSVPIPKSPIDVEKNGPSSLLYLAPLFCIVILRYTVLPSLVISCRWQFIDQNSFA